ncbi:MAG: MFS transporter [Pseudoruegeria sp.]
MLDVLKSSWALLLGMLLLMVGNGMQGTLLGVRGDIEGFSTFEMSIIVSAYFVGFLFASRQTPNWIKRVGHVRVFAALGSFISAVIILYPALTNPIAWTIGRFIVGYCFCGVYVTAESWLNHSATNDNRGKALSLYLLVQMAGIVTAQFMITMGDPAGFILFVIPSVLVSISFAPILLSISPTPVFGTAKPMTLRELVTISPLGCVTMALLGGIFSAQFGMSAVYGSEAGMTVPEISTFISAIYIGALVMQYPIGWVSDRMDRRVLIIAVAIVGGVASVLAMIYGSNFAILLPLAFLIGGCSNPLYALAIAYTNDFLEPEDMAAASGGLLFINGLGAIAGPVTTGWLMGAIGPEGFFAFLAILLFCVVLFGLYRTTQRAAPSIEDTGHYAAISPSASPIVVEVAQEVAIETALEEESSI